MILFYERKEETVRLVHGTQVTHRFPMHTHHTLIVGIVLRGQRYIGLRDKILSAGPGTVFLIQPGEPHNCYSDQSGGHDYWVLSFSQNIIQSIDAPGLTRETLASRIGAKVIRDPELFQEALDLIALWSAPSQFQRPIRMVRHFLTSLFPSSIGPATTPGAARTKRYRLQMSAIQKIRIYIERHVTESIGLDQLGQVAGLSPFYMNRLFRELIGLAPHAYQIQERIKSGQQLLKKGRPLTEIAFETGFADQSHFNRFFKKHTGVTPGQYAAGAAL